MTVLELHIIIQSLNNEMYELHDNDEICLELRSIGSENCIIKFLGMQIWNSYDEDNDIDESLELIALLKIRINNIITEISAIKI